MPEQLQKITVLLADDHPLMRKGLKEMIEEEAVFQIIAEASNGGSALALIEQLQPAIAVLDIDMPKMNGLEVATAAKQKKISTRIIVLTMYDTENIFTKALESGVMGYVLKESAATEIVEAIKNVSQGKYYITPSMSGHLMKPFTRPNVHSEEVSTIFQLTPTEHKILALISQNKSSKEIADTLFISLRTVETHRNNICQKLNLRGVNALLKFALENKHRL